MNGDKEETVALTRDFRETVQARAQGDAKFREALFTEAVNAYLDGDTASGKAILRDLVNATIARSVAMALKASVARSSTTKSAPSV